MSISNTHRIVIAVILFTCAAMSFAAPALVLYEKPGVVKVEGSFTEAGAPLDLDPFYFTNYFYDRVYFFPWVFLKLGEDVKDKVAETVYLNMKAGAVITVTFDASQTRSRIQETCTLKISDDGALITVAIPKETLSYHNVQGRMIREDYLLNDAYAAKKEKSTEKYDVADYYIFNEATDDDEKSEALLKSYFESVRDNQKKFFALLALSQYYSSRHDDDQALDYLNRAADFAGSHGNSAFMQGFLVMGKDMRRIALRLAELKKQAL